MLNGIAEFTIVPEYKIRGTTFWVTVPGSDHPVARIRRDVGALGSVGGLHRVFVGPNLDEFAGFVSHTGAYDSTKTKIGFMAVEESGFAALENPWAFCQADMEPLVENSTGLVGKIVKFPVLGFLSYFVSPLLIILGVIAGGRRSSEFRSERSPGFRMDKTTRIANRFHFAIHDPRVNVLLVFSCFLVAHRTWGFINPVRFSTNFLSHFDPKSWKAPKAVVDRM